MKVSDFTFDLPEELIAQDPLEDRSSSRLLTLDKNTGEIGHDIFHNIVNYLKPGDCLVLNNTKVIPARLIGAKEETGGKVEVLLLKRKQDNVWETLVKPGKKARPGYTDIKDALDGLFANRAKYVIYTKGADGAEIYTKKGSVIGAPGYKIDVRDTTGAGDSFIGAFLYCLLNDEVENLENVDDDTLRRYLDFANAYAANTTTKEGALAAMADKAEMEEWIKKF